MPTTPTPADGTTALDASSASPTGGAAEPAAPAGADRGRVHATDGPGRKNLRLAALVVFALLLLVTRFARLGERPLHHDESIHAFQSRQLGLEGTWKYDPAYHGPFLYYANALVYKIAGATNASARFLPALFGVGLVLLAIPLAAWFGMEVAIAYALLLLISPHLAYFSRFIREDLYSLVFTFGTIVAFRKFLETDRSRWLTLSAVSFALAGATKENAYMTGVLFVVFGAWTFAERWLTSADGGAGATAKRSMVWAQDRRTPITIAAVAFLSVWSVLYSAFGRYPGDWWRAIPRAIGYWMGQHSIARIPGPWYYYFPQILMYETGTLVAALLILRRREVRRDRFIRSVACAAAGITLAAIVSGLLPGKGESLEKWAPIAITLAGLVAAVGILRRPAAQTGDEERAAPMLRFMFFWTLASLVIYGWAREKVPWLTVHPLLPLTILASVGLADLWRDRKRSGPRLALLAVGMLLAVNAHAMYLACFRYGAHDVAREPSHAEMLAYVQTTKDLVRALESVDKAKSRVPEGQNVITVTGEASWPLTWYLRDIRTNWATRVDEASTPIIVTDWDAQGGLEKQLEEQYTATRVPIRAWWFPNEVAAEGKNPARPTISDLFSLWISHEIWSPIGSQDATFFVRKDLAGTGVLEPLHIPLKDPTARDYNGDAGVVPPASAFGGPGNAPGQFLEPRGVAVDARGTLYVADSKNNRIQIFDGTGHFVRQFGSKGAGLTELNEPGGVATDARGDLWIADTWNARVVHYAADGRALAAIGGPENAFFGPRAVVVSKDVVFVADTGNKKIVRFDRDGKRLGDFGGDGSGPGQFVEPVGLAADPAGNIYVADTGNHRIQVFDGEGKFLRQFPVSGWKDFYTEPYLAIGPGDMLFVTDAWAGRVAVYDPRGVMRRSWKADGEFKQPTGIAIDPYGRVVVSDRSTNRILTWALTAVLP